MIFPNIWENQSHVPNHQPEQTVKLFLSAFLVGSLPHWPSNSPISIISPQWLQQEEHSRQRSGLLSGATRAISMQTCCVQHCSYVSWLNHVKLPHINLMKMMNISCVGHCSTIMEGWPSPCMGIWLNTAEAYGDLESSPVLILMPHMVTLLRALEFSKIGISCRNDYTTKHIDFWVLPVCRKIQHIIYQTNIQKP